MANANWILPALCLSLLSACAAPLDDEPAAAAVGEPISKYTAPVMPDFVAWTPSGELALADGRTGAVRQRVAVPGPTLPRDTAWDPWQHRVLTVRGTDDGEGGEIAAVPVKSGRAREALGAASHVAWIDGEARLLPTPRGAVLFERGYADRWKLLSTTPTAGASALPPASAWLTVSESGVTVHALSGPDASASLERIDAPIGPGGVGAPAVTPISVPAASIPAAARLVPAGGAAVLLDIQANTVVVRRVDGGAAGPASIVPLTTSGRRIAAAVPLFDGEVVAALLAGSAEIVAVAIGAEGTVTSAAVLSLDGDVEDAPRFFSRSLAAAGPAALLVATSAGVHAVDVTRSDEAMHLAKRGGFDGAALRGPIAVLDRAP